MSWLATGIINIITFIPTWFDKNVSWDPWVEDEAQKNKSTRECEVQIWLQEGIWFAFCQLSDPFEIDTVNGWGTSKCKKSPIQLHNRCRERGFQGRALKWLRIPSLRPRRRIRETIELFPSTCCESFIYIVFFTSMFVPVSLAWATRYKISWKLSCLMQAETICLH